MKNVVVQDILEYLSSNSLLYEFYGDKNTEIQGISSIGDYQDNTLTWIKSKEKYEVVKDKLNKKITGLIILDRETYHLAEFVNAIVCKNPKCIFFSIVENFYVDKKDMSCIGKHTVIEDTADIGENVYIGSHCYIGENVKIGDGTKIYHNVVISDNVQIGKHCCIKSGTVIGEEGYGYYEKGGRYSRVPHMGKVIIGDYVDIGANTCIDRGTMDATVIGNGCKIDNLCHIAHNVEIGKNVMVIAESVICGSVVIEDNVYIAPRVAIKNQIVVGKSGLIGLGAVVTKDTKENHVYVGAPAKDLRERGDENL